MSRRLLLVAGVALLVAAPLALRAQNRAALGRARKLLERIKLVDGRDSGLDADTVRGVAPLIVVDAKGTMVGSVLVGSNPLSVVRKVDGRAMVFDFNADGFVTTNCPQLCYQSSDCSGTASVTADNAILPFVYVCGTTAYYPTGPVTSPTVGSCRTLGDPCMPQPPDTQIPLSAFATFDLSSLGFVAPFHVEGP